jgi:hypothetical protein
VLAVGSGVGASSLLAASGSAPAAASLFTETQLASRRRTGVRPGKTTISELPQNARSDAKSSGLG